MFGKNRFHSALSWCLMLILIFILLSMLFRYYLNENAVSNMFDFSDKYNVTYVYDFNKVNLDGEHIIRQGKTLEFKLFPKNGYEVDEVISEINGVDVAVWRETTNSNLCAIPDWDVQGDVTVTVIMKQAEVNL